ncbi:MAG: prepilin peptidase [Planctomycetaceae bacterium]
MIMLGPVYLRLLRESCRLTEPPRFRFIYHRQARLVTIWLSVSALIVGYVVLTAYWQSRTDRWVRFSDALLPRAMDMLIAAWLFFVGSSIGSFLNVVAWRMPRGVSVNGRSHCPRCNQTLSWKDNWPVFGWLALAGRCRTCHLPISPRYPVVELVVGLSLLFVGWRELFGAGATLPFHPDQGGRGGALIAPTITTENLLIMLYHGVAVAAAWAMGLVRLDGHRLPRSLVLVCLSMVVLPLLVYPAVAVVPWQVTMADNWRASGHYLDGAMRVITGLAAAVVIARALARFMAPTADPKQNPLGQGTARLLDLIAMLSVAGVVVGWQAALAVTVLAVLIAWVMPWVLPNYRDPLARLAIALPIALVIQLCFWRTWHTLDYWPSVGTAPVVTLGWAAAVLVLPGLLTRQVVTDAPDPGQDQDRDQAVDVDLM